MIGLHVQLATNDIVYELHNYIFFTMPGLSGILHSYSIHQDWKNDGVIHLQIFCVNTLWLQPCCITVVFIGIDVVQTVECVC